MTRQLRHALWGTAAATGAPLGWLALRVLSGACADLRDELAAHALLYGYLLAGTAMAFALFGAVTGRLADDVARANRRLAELSLTDGLTGLKNRRAFDEQLRRELERARRSGAPFAVVLVDLDHFKALNDRYGHPAGDRALQAAASLLGRAVRSQDSVYRVGGEEFAILCPGAGGKAAARVAERVRAALEARPLELGAGPVRVTASFGVAGWERTSSAEALLRAADDALYRAKRAGRNRVELHGAAPDLKSAGGPTLAPALAPAGEDDAKDPGRV